MASSSHQLSGVGFPLACLFIDTFLVLNAAKDFGPDPRTTSRLLLDTSPTIPVLIGLLYVFFSCVWGPRLMRDRTPAKLSNVLLIYNSFQILLSFTIFLEVARYGWFSHYSWRCQGRGEGTDEASMRVARAAHWFYLSKIIDLLDTIFFVARGKFNQVSTLHVTHHSSMVVSTWLVAVYSPGGHPTMTIMLNSFVHTIMYSYYLLAALGPRVRPFLWWKRYLTQLQLVQFLGIFLHMAQLVVFPCPDVPRSMVTFVIVNVMLFIVLFIKFYLDSYIKNKPSSASVKLD